MIVLYNSWLHDYENLSALFFNHVYDDMIIDKNVFFTDRRPPRSSGLARSLLEEDLPARLLVWTFCISSSLIT